MSKTNKRTIEADHVYTFSKSGAKVRTIAPASPYMRQACWTAERTEGTSIGKRMTVPADSLH